MAESTRHRILILQHPQEPDHELGSARLAHEILSQSVLAVGLSWPNLAKALGDASAVPSRWAVCYLGSGIKTAERPAAGLLFVDKKGVPLAHQPAPDEVDGIVLLDGTWSQAKTLWWRNAWLLKLKRAILRPKSRSLYGKLRREPRPECVSTIETIAEALEALGERPELSKVLRERFVALLENQKRL